MGHNGYVTKTSKENSSPNTADPATLLDHDACYRALSSHDARFDGRFFVAVSTTGIYCRPVCRVRLPKATNCSFYTTAAKAEQSGYRPCLRCRPELAPGTVTSDTGLQLATAAAHMIDRTLQEGQSLAELAAKLGISERHLRRLFESKFGVSPIEYLQTQRLLLAKRLLTDTALSVTQIAFAAGFNSIRRLNASMLERYGMSPTALRKTSPEKMATALHLMLSLTVREPYDFAWLLRFLGSRAIDGLEIVNDRSYQRVVSYQHKDEILVGWVKVSQSKPSSRAQRPQTSSTLILEVSQQLAPVIAQVLATVKNIFDIDSDPEHLIEALGTVAAKQPGIRLPGTASGFEIAVRAVLGQQITVKAARTLAARFVARFGERCEFDDAPGLTRAFPDPDKIKRVHNASIAKLGIISRRAETIKAVAHAITADGLDLSPSAPVEDTLKRLNDIKGIGDWTAQYIAMRALRWPDAFPAADYGVMKALEVSTPAAARTIAEQWQPWRAYAVMHLWASLADKSAAKTTLKEVNT